jgi:hypothetical protein
MSSIRLGTSAFTLAGWEDAFRQAPRLKRNASERRNRIWKPRDLRANRSTGALPRRVE